MGSISKTLRKMSGLKAGYGFAFLMTYREKFHLSASEDQVVVQLAKALFPSGELPEEISVTVEWNDPS